MITTLSQEGCARVMLFRGADRSILNYSNQTAYQVAVISNNMDLADLIKNHKDEDVGEYFGDFFFLVRACCSGLLPLCDITIVSLKYVILLHLLCAHCMTCMCSLHAFLYLCIT